MMKSKWIEFPWCGQMTRVRGGCCTSCHKAVEPEKGNKDERLKWLRTFDNCVLPKKVSDMIDEALTIILRSDIFEAWGLTEQFEKGLTNSIMLSLKTQCPTTLALA